MLSLIEEVLQPLNMQLKSLLEKYIELLSADTQTLNNILIELKEKDSESLQLRRELINENGHFANNEAEVIMEEEEEIATYCNKYLEDKYEWMNLSYDKFHSVVDTENVQLQHQFVQILINDSTKLKPFENLEQTMDGLQTKSNDIKMEMQKYKEKMEDLITRYGQQFHEHQEECKLLEPIYKELRYENIDCNDEINALLKVLNLNSIDNLNQVYTQNDELSNEIEEIQSKFQTNNNDNPMNNTGLLENA